MILKVDATFCTDCYTTEHGRWGYCYHCGGDNVFWNSDVPVFIPDYKLDLERMVINFEVWECQHCKEEMAGRPERCECCGSSKIFYKRQATIEFDKKEIQFP